MNWKRSIVALACPAGILWLGGDALSNISDLYDGLCPTLQGPGMKVLLYDGNPQGYCTGIGDYISTLGIIMALAAFAVPASLVAWWHRLDSRKISN